MTKVTTGGYGNATEPEDAQIVLRGPEGYGRCPRSLLRNSGLSVQARWLWTALEDLASPESEMPFPKQETLAEWAGVTVRTVQRWITELEKAGRLVSHQRGLRRSNLYELVWPGYEARSDTTSVSPLDTTSMSPLDTTSVSYEAEPLKAEPLEAFPPTPQGAKKPMLAELFDEWWSDHYPAKKGSRRNAQRSFARCWKAEGWDFIVKTTANYTEARVTFAAAAALDGFEVEAPVMNGSTFLNSWVGEFTEAWPQERCLDHWAPVLWNAARPAGVRSTPVDPRELARRADAEEGRS